MNKVFCFFTFLIADPEWIAMDKVSLLGSPSSLLFLFLSKVSSSHEFVPITLDVVPSVSILNILLLAEVRVFVAKEKGFFKAYEMSFEDSRPFSSSKVFFATSLDSIDYNVPTWRCIGVKGGRMIAK